ncbi:MAG: MFS transporter [Propionibacteriaceae bacterium]|nr:MFS transporter [Propionibacteriaceae bacterium]
MRLIRLFLPAQGLTSEARWILFIEAALNASKVSVPFLTLYLAQCRGLSFAVAGLFLAVRGVGGLFSVFLAGAAADLWGERQVLIITIAGMSVAAVAIPHLEGIGALVAGFFILGFFINAAQPVFSSLIVRSMPAEKWMEVYAAEYWALNVGFAVTAIAGGQIAAWNYSALFYIEAAATLVSLFLVLWKIPAQPSRVKIAHLGDWAWQSLLHKAHRGLGKISLAARDKLAVALISSVFLFSLSLSQMTSTLPLDMEILGYGPDEYGNAIFWNGVMLALFQLFTGNVLRKQSRVKTLAVAALVAALGYMLLAFTATGIWFILLCITIWTLGEMLEAPMRNVLVSSLAQPGSRGRYMGLLSAALTTGYCFGPLAGGWVLQLFGREALWLGTGVLCLAAVVIRLAIAGSVNRRLA